MKMKVFLNVMLILLCFCPSQVPAIGFEAVIEGITVVSEKANIIYQSLTNKNEITPTDVFAYLEAIPVIGSIANIFNDAKKKEQEIILNKLDSLLNRQEYVINIVDTLGKKIDFLVTNVQITQATGCINSCAKDRIHYLRTPNSIPEQKDLTEGCYQTLMACIRSIKDIITDTQISGPPFFQLTIEKDGFCDGSKIQNSYTYLLGKVVEGCEIVIIAEQLKYNGSTTKYLDECKTIIGNMTYHLKNTIFSRCMTDSCDIIQEILKPIVKSSSDLNTEHLLTDISEKFPWFTFSLFKFTSEPGLQISGDILPSVKTFHATGSYVCVVWTPYETRSALGNSLSGFALKFNRDYFQSASIAMNVSQNLVSNPIYIIANVVKGGISTYNACENSVINLDDKTTSNSVTAVIQKFSVFISILTVFIFE